jgi:hypothetical protein
VWAECTGHTNSVQERVGIVAYVLGGQIWILHAGANVVRHMYCC